MSSADKLDGADVDAQDFLKSVSEMREKRLAEDNERYHKLEEQVLQDREARLARRMERERSLSPEKGDLSTTPLSLRSQRAGTPRAMTPSSTFTPHGETLAQGASTPLSKPSSPALATTAERPSSPLKASPSAAIPTRSNTLSWQQRRPQSGSLRGRPLSMVATENSARSPQRATFNMPVEGEEPSRKQIAEALGSKDPSWFRQTEDRGLGSAAFRRNKENTTAENSSTKRHLPGLSKESSEDAIDRTSPPPESSQSISPSRLGSVRDSAGLSSRFSTATSVSEQSKSEDKSPFPSSDSHRFASSGLERPASMASFDGEQSSIGRTMSSAQSRIAADRPPSPTKGMGGFVQSAMLKRTDSVNKRWSAQPGASLSRQNSTASVMSGYGGLRDGLPGIGASRTMPDLNGQATLRQDNSTEPNSRPGSSHSTISNLTLTQEPNVKDRFARPALPHAHSRSKSVASLRDPPLLETSAEGENPISPPLSPSKRFSIRSRSPTKSSWLESALARPDSPQLKPATSTQPEWMANINKTKQQRNSAESTGSQGASDAEIMTATAKSLSAKPVKVTPKEPVAFGQSVLKRSPSKDLSNDPKRSITPPTKPKPLISQTLPKTPVLEQGPADVEKPPQVDVEDRGAKSPAAGLSPSISHSAKSSITSPSLSLTSPKPKPETPPKKDFRANLKPRQINVEASKSDEPEFKNVFGKLKKTQTEKYMAPDELKNNILRGKSGLTVTGGPQKTERRDELKESLLQKKEEMKAKAAEGGSEHQRSLSSVKTEAPALPEALQIKKQLGRSDSLKPSNAPANARRDVTPEALSLHRTLRGKPKLEHPQTGDRSPVEQEKKEPPLENTKSPSETEKQEPLHKVATFPLTHEEASQPLSRAPSDASLKKVSSASEAEGKSTPVSNKFADRFNPGLAGLLARGPPPQASQSNTPRSVSPAGAAVAGCPAASDETGEGVTLTHMTKSRAKGPKRRKPGTKESNPEPGLVKTATVPTGIKVEKRISAQLVKSNNFSPSSPTTKMPLQPAPKSAAVRAVSLSMSPAPAEKEKPITPTKSSSLSLKASPKLASKEEQTSQPPSPGMPAPSSVARKDSSQVRRFPTESAKSAASIDAATATPSTDSLAVKSLKATEPSDANKENANSSVKNVAALWGKSVPKLEPQKRGSPIPLPTKKDEEAAMKAAGLLSTSPMRYKGSPVLGLGISSKELPKPPGRVATPTGSAGLPPKPPTKSSRVVSGALQERFGSKGMPH